MAAFLCTQADVILLSNFCPLCTLIFVLVDLFLWTTALFCGCWSLYHIAWVSLRRRSIIIFACMAICMNLVRLTVYSGGIDLSCQSRRYIGGGLGLCRSVGMHALASVCLWVFLSLYFRSVCPSDGRYYSCVCRSQLQ